MARKVMTLLLALSALLPLYATGTTEEAQSTGDQPYRFSYAYGPWDLSMGRIDVDEQPDDPYFQYIEETTGVGPLTISWEWEGATGFVQGLRLHLASGELPDAMKIADLPLTVEMIENGLLLPLDDLLAEHAPDVLASIPEAELNLIRAQSPDGKLYYMPQIRDLPQLRAGFVRTDWLERVGLDVPTTRDELLEMYRAFRDQDANGNGDPNDEIPVSGREGMRWADDLFQIHGVSMHEGHPRLEWDADQQRMISHQVSDAMRDSIEFIRLLIEEGLMDETFPIQSRSDWSAKINANRVGHYYHLISEMDRFSGFIADNPDADWEYLPLVRVPGIPQQRHTWAQLGTDYPVFSVSSAAEDPARIVQWYNWSVTTQEANSYTNLGIPGVDWRRTDGEIEILNEVVPQYKFTTDGRLAFSPEILALSDLGETKIRILDQAVATGWDTYDDLGIPATVYDGYEDFRPQTAVLYREYASRMILGELPMSAWDEYVEEWYARGGDVVLDRATEWYLEVNQ